MRKRSWPGSRHDSFSAVNLDHEGSVLGLENLTTEEDEEEELEEGKKLISP